MPTLIASLPAHTPNRMAHPPHNTAGHPLVPVDRNDSPRISRPASHAGGVGSLAATVRYTLPESGLARGLSTLAQLNQQAGFDCPGCAWPEGHDRSFAEFCENGAKHVADEATTKRLDAAWFAARSIESLAAESDFWLNRQGRITEPLICRDGDTHYRPIAWEELFAELGTALARLPSPHRAAFYTSGRASNEAAFLYQAFVRALGTNNLPDCSNLCHESSGWALRDSIGVGKGTVSLADFDQADTILVIGQNPATNHPRMLSTLQEAARRGANIIAINPLIEPGLQRFAHPKEPWTFATAGTRLATRYLQVRIGGDGALLKGVMKALLDLEAAKPNAIDRTFIEQHTEGFEALRADLEGRDFAALEARSGIDRATMRELAELLARSPRAIYCWAMGLTQHEHATDLIQEVVNLALLRGHLGKQGAGLCPVRGHSNVQGDRTMGIDEKPTEAFLSRMDAALGFRSPREHGYDVVETIHAMHRGDLDLFVALGGNFLSAVPDTAYTAAALARCSWTVQISTKLNRSHLLGGRNRVILPCLGRTEIDLQSTGPQRVSVEDSMSCVHASRGHLDPASPHLLSEPMIVARLAQATLGNHPLPWVELASDYRRIRSLIERAIPGFENFETRLDQPDGFVLPNTARQRRWSTADGKAGFRCLPLPAEDLRPGELHLMTLRSHDQYNTAIYGLDDRYRGVRRGRMVLFANADDLAERGLLPGQQVTVAHERNGRTLAANGFTLVAYDLPRGNLAGYFPELNPVVPLDRVARNSGTPIFKSVPVTILRYEGLPQAAPDSHAAP